MKFVEFFYTGEMKEHYKDFLDLGAVWAGRSEGAGGGL